MSKRETLAINLIRTAKQKGITLATAESCTGGWIGKSLTDPAGASSVFMGALVTYANSAKSALLGTPETMLSEYGAVSSEVAGAMAEGALTALGTDMAISVTGIAGPNGGTDAKPIGTVWFGLARKGHPTETIRQDFGNKGRDRVRKLSVIYALEWLSDACT